ncbi:hypothetical protein C7402_102292 [Paraburkholderia unamae]|uniref:Uncharacterized protein n=1 Tax=Paraburkholderia unamae TaxID=219649 RepID=A0ABX5KTR9_9BURK|nr:hypothetical protein C7402_102292 [Paraburkholderia unamae]
MTAWGIVAAVTAFCFGWGCAHSTIARECDRLGAFYVGKTTYVCVGKESR